MQICVEALFFKLQTMGFLTDITAALRSLPTAAEKIPDVQRANQESVDTAFVTTVKGLVHKIFDNQEDAHDQFDRLKASSPLRLAQALQAIVLDKKNSETIRIAALMTFEIKELPLHIPTAEKLFLDKETPTRLKLDAIEVLLLDANQDPQINRYLIALTRSKEHGTNATRILAKLRDPSLSTLFITLALNKNLPSDNRAAALLGLQNLGTKHAFDKIRPLLGNPALVQQTSATLLSLDPKRGLEALCRIHQPYEGMIWRSRLLKDFAHNHPDIAKAFLERGIAEHSDSIALCTGVYTSKKFSTNDLLKLPRQPLSELASAVRTLPGQESIDFLKKVVQAKPEYWEVVQVASTALLEQKNYSALPDLARSYIDQAISGTDGQNALATTTEILSSFLREPLGYDRFIAATQTAVAKLERENASQERIKAGKLILKILPECKAQNFSTPFRFSPDEMSVFLRENRNPTRYATKLAVVILPAADQNGAFDRDTSVRSLVANGYTVRIAVAATDEEVAQFIEKVKQTQRSPDVIVIGGHGSPSSIHLGNGKNGAALLDLGDKRFMARMNKCMHLNSILVLNSCSTASRDSLTPNTIHSEVLKNMDSIVFGKVYGATKVAYGFRFIFDANKKVSAVEYLYQGSNNTFYWGENPLKKS